MSLTGMPVTSANFVSNLPHEMILLEGTRYVSICTSLKACGYGPLTHWSWLQNNSAETSFQLKIPSNVSQGRNIAPITKGGNGQRGNAAGSQKKKSKSFIYLLIELGLSLAAGLSTLEVLAVCPGVCTRGRGGQERRGRGAYTEQGA